MNTRTAPLPSAYAAPRKSSNGATLLYERATLDGLECRELSWEDWDRCVAEQDLRAAITRAFH